MGTCGGESGIFGSVPLGVPANTYNLIRI